MIYKQSKYLKFSVISMPSRYKRASSARISIGSAIHAAIIIAHRRRFLMRSQRILRQSSISSALRGHLPVCPQLLQVYDSVVSIKFISLDWMNFWNDPRYTVLAFSSFSLMAAVSV